MRTFVLRRNEDISGVSGVGIVAEGIEFSDGVVALRWLVPSGNPGSGNPTSVVFHDNGMSERREDPRPQRSDAGRVHAGP